MKNLLTGVPRTIDSFSGSGGGDEPYLLEYDGWHFENKSSRVAINDMLRYLFKQQKKDELINLYLALQCIDEEKASFKTKKAKEEEIIYLKKRIKILGGKWK